MSVRFPEAPDVSHSWETLQAKPGPGHSPPAPRWLLPSAAPRGPAGRAWEHLDFGVEAEGRCRSEVF